MEIGSKINNMDMYDFQKIYTNWSYIINKHKNYDKKGVETWPDKAKYYLN